MVKRTIGVSLVTGDDVEILERIEPAANGVIEMQPPSRNAILRRVIYGPQTKGRQRDVQA